MISRSSAALNRQRIRRGLQKKEIPFKSSETLLILSIQFCDPVPVPREKTRKFVMVAVHASHEMRVSDRHSELEYKYASPLPLD